MILHCSYHHRFNHPIYTITLQTWVGKIIKKVLVEKKCIYGFSNIKWKE